MSASAAVFSAAVTTRSLVQQQQQQLTTSIQLLQQPGPGQWLVKCHLSPVPYSPYTGLHWPRLQTVWTLDRAAVWRLCPLWAGEQGGGGVVLQSGPSHIQPGAQGPRLMMSSREQTTLGNITSVDFRLILQNSIFPLQCLTIDGFI